MRPSLMMYFHSFKSHEFHNFKTYFKLKKSNYQINSLKVMLETKHNLCLYIVQIIYKLEMIFSTSLFDSMEYLPIHLLFETKVRDLVQYR